MFRVAGLDGYLELKMLGTIISAIAYGVVVVLSGNCLLLLKKRGTYSNRMRLFLLIYVTIMSLLSTLAMIGSIWGITLFIFRDVGLPMHLLYWNQAIPPLTIWGADGFMVSILCLRQNEDSLNAIAGMALRHIVSGRN